MAGRGQVPRLALRERDLERRDADVRRLVERKVGQPVEPPRVDPAVPALEHQRVAALLQQLGDERRVARRLRDRRQPARGGADQVQVAAIGASIDCCSAT